MRSSSLPLVWLLDLELGGVTWHLSSRPVVVTFGDSGKTIQYDGGMDKLVLTESLGAVGTLPGERSATLHAMPTGSIAKLSAEGHDLADGRATLRLWIEGDDGDQAEVQIRNGRCRRPHAGDAGEALALTISAEPYDDRTSTIPAGARVDFDTWPSAAPGENGQLYPFVWATPGVYGADSTRAPSTPALCVLYDSGASRASTLLVAGHPVEATSVDIWYRIDEVRAAYVTVGVSTVTDGLGREVAVCDISGLSATIREAGEWWASWNNGGARRSAHRGKACETFGEVVRDMLHRAEIEIDHASWATVEGQLPYPAGWYTADDMSHVEAAQRLLRSTPVGLWSSPRGLAAVLWPSSATRSEAVERFVEGRQCTRVGGQRATRRPREVTTEVRVGFAEDRARSSHRRWHVITPDPYADGGATTSDIYTRTTRAGPAAKQLSHVETLEWAYERRSASWVAGFLSRSRAVSPREISLDVHQSLAMHLRLGDVVTYTAPDLGATEAVAMLVERGITDEPVWPLRLMLFAGTASDVQAFGDGTSPDVPTPGPGT